LLYLKVSWYILPVLVSCSNKNLATLHYTQKSQIFTFGKCFEEGISFFAVGAAKVQLGMQVSRRAARFLLPQNTKTGKT
jgi:hypothetical protein